MSGRGASPRVLASVDDLDHDLVVAALATHECNVSDAAADLGVSASALRRLIWGNPSLQDQAFEVVEARLDLAEKNLYEDLRSEDRRVRAAATFYTLRNTASARRRGLITSAATPDVVVGGRLYFAGLGRMTTRRQPMMISLSNTKPIPSPRTRRARSSTAIRRARSSYRASCA